MINQHSILLIQYLSKYYKDPQLGFKEHLLVYGVTMELYEAVLDIDIYSL